MLEVPAGLRGARGATGEAAQMAAFVERETKRRQFLVQRWNLREQERIESEIEAKKKAGVCYSILNSFSSTHSVILSYYSLSHIHLYLFFCLISLRTEQDLFRAYNTCM